MTGLVLESLPRPMTQIQDLLSALTVAQLLSAGRVESDHLAATLRFEKWPGQRFSKGSNWSSFLWLYGHLMDLPVLARGVNELGGIPTMKRTLVLQLHPQKRGGLLPSSR